ncbi:putative hydrolase [Escherichia coli]|nr:putative hydrolase [Escherichia coli]
MLEKSLATLFALLILATLINRFLVWRLPERKGGEVTLRIRTWWGIVICFSMVISGPRWMTLTFFALISFLALKEYCTLISVHFPRWLYWGIPLNYLLIGFNCFELFLLFIPLAGFLILATWRVLVGDPSGFLHTVSAIFCGWIMTVFTLSHAAWLLMLPTINIQGGALLVLFLLALTESNDIAQYLWGKSCGRRKVVPKVSPGKTLEGLMGGVITTMIASLIIGPLLTPLDTLQALLAGLLIGISGFCGDVVMSAIKRDIGVKDSGKLLPGHGGLLDRIDSLIFTAPVFFYFIRYCCYCRKIEKMENSRIPGEHFFTTSDNTALFYRHWPTLQPGVKKVIVLFHRGHEHSGRLQHIVDELAMPDTAFYAWDARGHGQTSGPRGYSPSLARSVQDVDEFVRFAASDSQVGLEEVVVIAQSVGAVMVATWVHDYAPAIRGLVLASPAFKVKLYVPLARPGLALWHRLRGLFFINSYVKGRYLTHDRQRVASFNNDPLITRAIAVNILLDLYKTSERIVSDAAAITLPTQLLISGDDYVVHRQPQIDFYQRLRSPLKELHLLPGFYHDTLGEENRAQAFEKMQSFISRLYANKSQKFDYQHEDRTGPSADRWRLLSGGPVPLSPVDLAYRFMRKAMKLFGAHSAGLHLGMSTGFDSGSSLDYVYQNQPQGSNAFGRLIDKIYLNSVGWRGIRQRKTHLQMLIKQAVADLHAKGLAIRVVDIAAGHGRYVLDALANEPAISEILLRDYSEVNVAQGQEMIAQRGMSGRARFEQGDAFNPAELSTLTPRPTLAIVSGLYELFPENEQVKNSLAGLANAIDPGGILIYTGQPWHPQLELIAGVLTSHKDGKPWVMRVRSQGEMDSLVHDAGFDKCTQRIDEWGIFTVSMAVRRDN